MEEVDIEVIVQRAREKYPGTAPRVSGDLLEVSVTLESNEQFERVFAELDGQFSDGAFGLIEGIAALGGRPHLPFQAIDDLVEVVQDLG
ncbi:MAG: hypothetical protein EA381_15900 [Planctomycetaceae bacterium]|nr:MAG: hypothetical protein EA381_15900 [Planctomycetaceae bacterium]